MPFILRYTKVGIDFVTTTKCSERFIKANYYTNSMERVIAKVRVNKLNGQKTITIPKESSIKSGDYVEVILVK